MSPDAHPLWEELTDRQREAVNAVWEDTVVHVLEENVRLARERDEARLEAQDARDALRRKGRTA